MNIDFSKDMQYWIDLIRAFIEVIAGFLADFNIKLFKDSEETTAPAADTADNG